MKFMRKPSYKMFDFLERERVKGEKIFYFIIIICK